MKVEITSGLDLWATNTYAEFKNGHMVPIHFYDFYDGLEDSELIAVSGPFTGGAGISIFSRDIRIWKEIKEPDPRFDYPVRSADDDYIGTLTNDGENWRFCTAEASYFGTLRAMTVIIDEQYDGYVDLSKGITARESFA